MKSEGIIVEELFKKCIEEFESIALSKKNTIRFDVSLSLSVSADKDLLFRVIQNLLDNASKFTPDGGVIHLQAKLGLDKKAILSVSDLGLGILPSEISNIFDRFCQARVRQEGCTRGTGLGLAFRRDALKAMGGSIEAMSKPNGGEYIRRSITLRG